MKSDFLNLLRSKCIRVYKYTLYFGRIQKIPRLCEPTIESARVLIAYACTAKATVFHVENRSFIIGNFYIIDYTPSFSGKTDNPDSVFETSVRRPNGEK